MRIVAHRGGARLWPENSLTAFRGALALGVDDLELDVHLTADGEVVVVHDPTLDRTTTGQGPVAARRLADLAGVRLRQAGGDATDERLPALAQVLDLLAPAAAAGLLLEIKVGVEGLRHPGIEERVLALVRDRGLAPRVQVMAFEEAAVARVRALDPSIRTVLLIGRRDAPRLGGPVKGASRAARLGAAGVGMDHRLVNAEVVAAARAAGLALGAWTVNDEPAIRRMLDLGVDSITSDRPDLALRLAGRKP